MLSKDDLLRAVEQLQGADVELPLELCPVAAAAQVCHNLGIIDETHVATQMYWRLLLQALGLERDAPEGAFDALRSFCETVQARLGMSASHLLHGAGASGVDGSLSVGEYVARRNSGAFHPRTVRRGFPATDTTMDEVILYDLLNFMVGARRAATTYLHSLQKRVCLAVTSADGMLIKEGLMFDRGAGKVFGAYSGPFGIDVAQPLQALDDDGLRVWLAKNKLASEVDEFMIATADNSVTGHLGCSMKSSGGGADSIIAGVARFVPIVACFECLLEAHKTGGDMASASAMCDIYCHRCAVAEIEMGEGHTCEEHDGLPPWPLRVCTRCVLLGRVCYSCVILGHNQDAGSPADTAIRARSKVREAVPRGAAVADDAPDDAPEVAPDGGDDAARGGGGGGRYVPHQAIDAAPVGKGDCASRWRTSTVEFGSDPPHDLKSLRNASKNHWLRVGGHLAGHRVLETLWHDVDAERRAAVRGAVPNSAVVARNKFSDADAMAAFEADLASAMLTDADRKAQSSLIAVTLGPEPYRGPLKNHKSLYGAPYGLAWDAKSGVLLYTDKTRGELRTLKIMDLPAPNALVVGGLIEPTGVALRAGGDFAYVACGARADDRAGRIVVVGVAAALDPRRRTKTADEPPAAGDEAVRMEGVEDDTHNTITSSNNLKGSTSRRKRATVRAAALTLAVAADGDGCLLAWPHGLAASSCGLFATDRASKAAFEVNFSCSAGLLCAKAWPGSSVNTDSSEPVQPTANGNAMPRSC